MVPNILLTIGWRGLVPALSSAMSVLSDKHGKAEIQNIGSAAWFFDHLDKIFAADGAKRAPYPAAVRIPSTKTACYKNVKKLWFVVLTCLRGWIYKSAH